MANFDSFIEKKKMRFYIGIKPSYFPYPRERGVDRNQKYLHEEIFKIHPTFEPFNENYQQRHSKWPRYEERRKYHSPEEKIVFNKFQPAATSTPCRRIFHAEEDYPAKRRQRYEFEFLKPKEINRNIPKKGAKNNPQQKYKFDFDQLIEKNHKSSKRCLRSGNVSPFYCKENIIQCGEETMNLINDFKGNLNADNEHFPSDPQPLIESQFEFDHTLFFDKKQNTTNVNTSFMKHFEANILNFEDEGNKKGSNRQRRKPSNYYDDDSFVVGIQQNPKIYSHNDHIKGDTIRLLEKIFKPKNNRNYFNIMDSDGTAEIRPLQRDDDNISLSSFNY